MYFINLSPFTNSGLVSSQGTHPLISTSILESIPHLYSVEFQINKELDGKLENICMLKLHILFQKHAYKTSTYMYSARGEYFFPKAGTGKPTLKADNSVCVCFTAPTSDKLPAETAPHSTSPYWGDTRTHYH